MDSPLNLKNLCEAQAIEDTNSVPFTVSNNFTKEPDEK